MNAVLPTSNYGQGTHINAMYNSTLFSQKNGLSTEKPKGFFEYGNF
jgi:hypothetical protein